MLVNRLSEKDQKLIESFIDMYGLNSGAEEYRSRKGLEDILRWWAEAKSEYLYRLFGEKFILEKKVEYNESPCAMENNMYRILKANPYYKTFDKDYRKMICDLNFDFGSNEYSVLYSLTSPSLLSKNTCGEDSYVNSMLPITIAFPDGQKLKIESNSKPMRTLGKIVKMFNLDAEAYESIRLDHSRALNTKKITGTLCLSIHPLDYMTMSTNRENWSSCMNWDHEEPGCYRGGTVEMMNSKMVVVGYLKSDNNVYDWGKEEEWNSKKWRILLAITPEEIVSIKGYPYYHKELTHMLIDSLKELASTNLNWIYGNICKVPCDTQFLYEDTNTFYTIDMQDSEAMYCDWGCDTHYGCFTLNPEESTVNHKLEYCGYRSCIYCGKVNHNFYDESFVICGECSSEVLDHGCYCCECGEWIDEGDAYWFDDNPYCPYCVDNVATPCAITGTYVLNEDIQQVYLAKETDNPTEDDRFTYVDQYYCLHAIPFYCASYLTGVVDRPRQSEYGLYYFDKEDLTERGMIELFGFHSNENIEEYFKN